MATVTETTTIRKAPRAYRAILDETTGTLTQVDGVLYFFTDEGEIVNVEPEHLNFLMTLGEVGLSETQALLDTMHGGPAAIACSRPQKMA